MYDQIGNSGVWLNPEIDRKPKKNTQAIEGS
jgi:hypothetical protein